MQPIHFTIAIVHVAAATAAIGHALLFKQHSRAALGWIAAVLIYPIVGPLAYVLFGINRIETRSHLLRDRTNETPNFHTARTRPTTDLDVFATVPSDQRRLVRIGSAISAYPLRGGNDAQLLRDGDGAYPAMLEAIDAAKERVWLATYIFETNSMGRRFIDALARAKARGLDVRVLLDGIGERYSRPRASRLLRAAGVDVARFLPPRLVPPQLYVNLRNHRKLLCIDSSVGFAGGMNIGGRHMVSAPETNHPTQDVHFRFAGPVVHDLERLFIHDWRFVESSDEEWTEATKSSVSDNDREAICRVVPDGPDHDINKLEALLTTLISAADHSVTLVTPYFLPSESMRSALVAASLRGVAVSVVLPERCNVPFVEPAMYRMLRDLLRYELSIYLQPGPFSHAKLAVFDGTYAVVGSSNLDPRSLRLNFEVGIEVLDPHLCGELRDYVDDVELRSKRLSLDSVLNRPLRRRIWDGLCWLFTPYL